MNGLAVPVITLLVIDAVFVLVVAGIMLALFGQHRAGVAVLKRNFVGYFNNPTGYLFILLFVALCSFWAFFPNDFFNDNLATLHQLNLRFPWIMLVYIPTITMGIWSEERRQGTDELLLTVPASDGDIVVGKYLAAVAIYTVSLIFSQVANFFVLAFLSQGEVDLGLFATTYLGYWLVGLSMISLGMVGSFLTSNLTIGFILGVLLNLPLVLGTYADAAFSGGMARVVARFSYAQQFFDFSRGVIGFRGLVFFALVIAIGLYLSIVLVGRRHWMGGKDGESLAGHYLVRVMSLVIVALGLSAFFMNRDVLRFDGTAEHVNSFSESTKQQISQLGGSADGDKGHVVQIEAFISKRIPEDYAMTRVDLISKLREFEARGGNRIRVLIHDNLEPFSDQAVRAEEQFGIRPTTVMVRERGAIRQEDIFLGAAITSGLEKVVVPFFDQGIPVEYELIRSICTVSDPKRKKVGIVTTDAQLFGGFDMQRMSQTPKQLIVQELEKQYEVVQLDPSSPIQERVDVMMVVQPSSLAQPQMDNLIAAVKAGTPTAIFEDPMPVMIRVPGTSQPKPPRGGGMMGMGGQPEPKGDIQGLWDVLGIRMVGDRQMGRFSASVVWQTYNPFKKADGFEQVTKEWVFASPNAPGGEVSLNPSEDVVSGLQQILMLFPGAIEPSGDPALTVTPIISTGTLSGTIATQELSSVNPNLLDFKRRPSLEPLRLAVRIRSARPPKKKDSVSQADAASIDTLPVAEDADDASKTDVPKTDAADGASAVASEDASEDAIDATISADQPNIDVVYVSDIDLMHSEFLRVRAQPNMGDINWRFDNVTFVLNVVDDLAGDDRFLVVRKKQTKYSTLKYIEAKAAMAREVMRKRIGSFNEKFEKLEADAGEKQRTAMAELEKKVTDLEQKAHESGTESSFREAQRALQAAVQQMTLKKRVEQRRLDTTVETLTRERDRQLRLIDRELDNDVRRIQNVCKTLALFLPMLPPLAIGLAVFIRRRSLESEGTATSRKR